MVRGTFANIRLRNKFAPGTEGGVTRLLPEGELMSIFDASVKYAERGVPLIILLAGKEYGSGSSRDWAARLLARVGRHCRKLDAYLVGMGILPLRFEASENVEWLRPHRRRDLRHSRFRERLNTKLDAKFANGRTVADHVAGQKTFEAHIRIDTPQEIEYFKHGGILQYVLRQLAAK